MTTEKQAKTRFRVVLDTNVYISIFTSPKGELGAIWEHALKRTYTLLISPAIVAELAKQLIIISLKEPRRNNLYQNARTVVRQFYRSIERRIVRLNARTIERATERRIERDYTTSFHYVYIFLADTAAGIYPLSWVCE